MVGQQQVNSVPPHIAIIMDGNGRWAQQRGLPRKAGHKAGVETVRHIVRVCADLGVEVLTLYVFSTENWGRSDPEVACLMRLAEEYALREVDELQRNNVQFRMLGRREGLPASLLRAMDEGIRRTAHNTGLVLNLAINYGGRAEIVDAARAVVTAVRQGQLNPALLDEDVLGRFLYTAGLPDPDLVIRTAGEMRLSNFLVWQVVGAVFWSTPVYWPDFDKTHLLAAIRAWQESRESI
ncbi:MAG: isoprenyl transferase [Chloroflexota bacterium]|nr:isoprenyl transferase [Chloroflexota bacterium]